MNFNKNRLFFFIPLLFINVAISQDNQLQLQVINGMIDALDKHDTCHYRTHMRFKYTGEDSFEIRNFNLSFRRNPDNLLYGYDWEFAEIKDNGNEERWIFLPETVYVVLDSHKIIIRKEADVQIHLGSFTETMRLYFSLEKVFEPFLNDSPYEVMVKDSGDVYFLDRRISDAATRRIIISKKTYLPVRAINIITESVFGFEQIQDTYYYFKDDCSLLPVTVFEVDHYFSSGYELIVPENKVESLSEEKKGFSAEDTEMLLTYPFVNAERDTITLTAAKGNYILLDFWFASCTPCLQAMPHVDALKEKYADKGLQVLGVNCFDKNVMTSLSNKLRMKNITMPLFYGSRDLVDALSISSYPTYILITPDQKVEILRESVNDVKNVLKGILGK